MKEKIKKELKLFALVLGLVILSSVSRRYIPADMFSAEQLEMIISIVVYVVFLCKFNIKNELNWIGLIILELLSSFLFASLSYFMLSYTFIEVLVLFLFVYTIFKIVQIVRDYS